MAIREKKLLRLDKLTLQFKLAVLKLLMFLYEQHVHVFR